MDWESEVNNIFIIFLLYVCLMSLWWYYFKICEMVLNDWCMLKVKWVNFKFLLKCLIISMLYI